MNASDHEHCLLGCEHPQPFTATPTVNAAREHGLYQCEQRFWFVDRPPFCTD